MIEYDRLEKLRERRLAGLGTGNTQTVPSTFSDRQTMDRLREERLNRIAAVAETEFAPQPEAKKKENSSVVPNKDASWWEKTKNFLRENPDPIQYIKSVANDVKEDIKFGIQNPEAGIEALRQGLGKLPEEEIQRRKEVVDAYNADIKRKFDAGEIDEKEYARLAVQSPALQFATEAGINAMNPVAGTVRRATGNLLRNVAKESTETLPSTTAPRVETKLPEPVEQNIEQSVVQAVNPQTGEKYYFTIKKGELPEFQELIDNTGVGAIAGKNIDGYQYHLTAHSPTTMEERGFKSSGTANLEDFKAIQKQSQGVVEITPVRTQPNTPEAKAVIDKGIENAAKTDAKIQERLRAVEMVTKTDSSVKPVMEDWLRNTYKGKVDAQKESLVFKIDESPENIYKQERGESYAGRDLYEKRIEELRLDAEKKLGIEIPKRANYVPHVYNQSPDQIKAAVANAMKEKGVDQSIIDGYLVGDGLDSELARSLKMEPHFTQERAFQTYEEAAKWGLTPKFDTMKQHLAHYVEKLNDVVANKQLVQDLIESKKITATEKSGLMAVNIPGNAGYYAEPKVASYLNDFFRNEDALNIQQKIVKKGAQFSQGLQNLVLAGGLPKTNVNFFTLGHVIKSLTAGVGNLATANLRGALTNFKALFNLVRSNFTSPSIAWFNQRVENGIMGKMANEGIDMSHVVGNYKETNRGLLKFFKKTEGKMKILGEGYDRVLSEKTFNSFLPMQTVSIFEDTYKTAIKKGLDEAAASKLAGDTTKQFMGLLDNLRGKSTDDLLSAAFFAPRFREGLIKTYWNSLKSLAPKNWGDKSFAQNRKLLIGMGITFFGGYQYLSQKLNGDGHYTWDNPPGKKLELMIPGKDGKVYYVPFMPSQLAFFRNVVEAGAAGVAGDTETAIQKTGSNLSMGIHLVTDLLANKDYFGNEIYDAQAPMGEQLSAIGKYLGQNANHPYVKGVWNMVLNANASNQAIYPTYEKVTKLLDNGERDEANRIINSLSPEDKQAYYELKKEKLKPMTQILSEMMELPVRFTTKGKIAAAKYYEKVDNIAREVKALPEGEERTAKIQEAVAETPENERRSLLNALTDAGVSTKGVSISEDIIRMKPTYQKVQELLATGKEKEARAIVDKLSEEDYKAYKKVRSAAIAAKTKSEKEQMRPVYDNVQALLAAGKEAEARKIVDDMTDREYEVYKLLKDE